MICSKYSHMLTIFILLALLILMYLIPAPKGDFFKRYGENNPVAQRLLNFRGRPLKSLSAEGVVWNYYSGGRGTKTLLFIHGMGGSYDIWWNQIHALESDFRILTFTLPEKINTLEKAKNGILKLLEQEKVDRFNLVGTSLGGYIAQYVVKAVPERVEKAVFGNTFPPNRLIVKVNQKKRAWLPWLPEIVLWQLGQRELQQKLLPAGHQDKVLSAFLPGLSFSKRQFINRYDMVVEPFITMRANPATRSVPKLILESDNDPLIPTLLRAKLKVTYPEAQVHTFRNEGHFPYLTSIEEYNHILLSFFRS